jgi:hypothetical protein
MRTLVLSVGGATLLWIVSAMSRRYRSNRDKDR